jgi:hypothetical protein
LTHKFHELFNILLFFVCFPPLPYFTFPLPLLHFPSSNRVVERETLQMRPNFPTLMVLRSMTNVRRRDKNHKVLRQAVRWTWWTRWAPRHHSSILVIPLTKLTRSIQIDRQREHRQKGGELKRKRV